MTDDPRPRRTTNMRYLVAETGGPTAWANAYGAKAPNGRIWSSAQVSQWISETNPKLIGERLARHLEHAQGLHPGALDNGDTPPTLPVSPTETGAPLADLAKLLAQTPDELRPAVGKLLESLALTPESPKVLDSLSALLKSEGDK